MKLPKIILLGTLLFLLFSRVTFAEVPSPTPDSSPKASSTPKASASPRTSPSSTPEASSSASPSTGGDKKEEVLGSADVLGATSTQSEMGKWIVMGIVGVAFAFVAAVAARKFTHGEE